MRRPDPDPGSSAAEASRGGPAAFGAPCEPACAAPAGTAELVFAALETEGPDPTQHALTGIRARLVGAGERREAAWTAAPGAGAAARARQAWSALERFAGERTLIVEDADLFAGFAAALGAEPAARDRWLGLAELAALAAPGRSAGAALPGPLGSSPGAAGPPELERAARALALSLAERGPGVGDFARAAWSSVARGFRGSEPATARWLERGLAALEALDGTAGAPRARSASAAFADDPAELLEALAPRWAGEAAARRPSDPLPPRASDPTPSEPADEAVLERVFERELPALFGDPSRYREGQHAVARQIAANFQAAELLVVHAPTGTGKTLAYLVPAMLWSVRHGVRVGIATYTRALQEQVISNDLGRARGALAGAAEGAREAEAAAARRAAGAEVAMLKGRDNYLCWRALVAQRPGPDDDPEVWLAWTWFALFALVDETGDLDRLPRRLPGPAFATERIAREHDLLLRHVRAAPSCCSSTRDRQSCAAEVARARAERSHVVVTNHSFALARPEFFRNLVFDECEHLHDQAERAWSHAFGLRAAQRFLARLADPRAPMSRAVLDALGRALPALGARDSLVGAFEHARGAAREAAVRLGELAREVDRFETWRAQAARTLRARDEHGLLRAYVEAGPSAALLAARAELSGAFEELEIGVTALILELALVDRRGVPRWRRALELARADLAELAEALDAWIPHSEGRPLFDAERLFDVEQDPRGERQLVARVLAPHEQLGRHYLPALQSAAFVSATTYLRGGFEAALGYLGLARCAEPAPEEERDARPARVFRAPSPFDHSRVLVCVPTDAPRVDRDARRFRAWVRAFLAHLGERTRGRVLALFTNSDDVVRTGAELAGFFRARSLPFWYQNMPGLAKEDLGARFRARVDSTLLGVDTFWYGADFPGETLEYLVIVRLPYGVPDRYYHAQCALLGSDVQRRRIYLPRALAKFRQGFGRLMRTESDRGVVFVLDARILEGSHRLFLGELPLASDAYRAPDSDWEEGGARLVAASSEACFQAAFEHMAIAASLIERGLAEPFAAGTAPVAADDAELDD